MRRCAKGLLIAVVLLLSALTAVAALAQSLPPLALPDLPLQTAASGLHFQDILVGGGAALRSGEQVTVTYVGYLDDGTVFDASAMHSPGTFTFTLGLGQTIKGWEEGVATMRVGGKRRLFVPPALGYGARQAGPIPPNSRLTFDVEVLSAGDPPQPMAMNPIVPPAPASLPACADLPTALSTTDGLSGLARTDLDLPGYEEDPTFDFGVRQADVGSIFCAFFGLVWRDPQPADGVRAVGVALGSLPSTESAGELFRISLKQVAALGGSAGTMLGAQGVGDADIAIQAPEDAPDDRFGPPSVAETFVRGPLIVTIVVQGPTASASLARAVELSRVVDGRIVGALQATVPSQ